MVRAVVSSPRFGFRYVVGAAICFDPPHDALDSLFTRRLATVDRVDDLLVDLRRVVADESTGLEHQLDGWVCAVRSTDVQVMSVDGETALAVATPTFLRILEQWRDHLVHVPEGLDRVATGAAAALRRIAAMSWIESAVAVVAGLGWSQEAAHLASIGRSIADGSVEQVSTMRDASDSWQRLRPALTARGRCDSQLHSIVDALDHLLGTN
jgi:hypothetical protein